MSLPRRSAFTLVELLVVIVILGLLMAMIFPAINRMRETTRETVCRDQMRNVAMAVEVFAEKQNHYPGWKHPFSTKNASGGTVKEYMPWVVPIMEYIDRSDVSDHIKANKPADIQWPYVELLICPSDRAKVDGSGPVLSYVGNAGREDKHESGKPYDYRSNAVFLDLSEPGVKRQTASFIIKADGKANTLLLSENLNANHFGKIADQILESDHCIVYHNSPTAIHRINSTPTASATPIDLARPSSNHRGGANVAMVGGNVRLLSDETDYGTYKSMLRVDDQFNDPDYP